MGQTESNALREEEEMVVMEQAKLQPAQVQRQIARAKLRIQAFRVRAGSTEICTALLTTWQDEKDRIMKTWSALSDPAKRALVNETREKVVMRAKVLHSVVASRASSSKSKSKVVRKLMEKTAFEIFDTSIIYDNANMGKLIEDVLQNKGGGPEVPFGLMLELNQTFDPDVRRFSYLSQMSSDGPNEIVGVDSNSKSNSNGIIRDSVDSENKSKGGGGSIDTNIRNGTANDRNGDTLVIDAEAKLSPGLTSPDSMITSMSSNSLQGYYSRNEKKTARRASASKTIQSLLSFIPPKSLDPVSRKSLTLELLLEMRHAFLIHFVILVFSELFDDTGAVVHKYEYDSDSDTDVGPTDTDLEEEEEEGE